jgi:RNA-binding motif X-linked protein 2
LNKLNENELKFGRVAGKSSWHNQYRESAWVFFAGLPYELTEGDIICVFSQYGEIVTVNLIRDRKTGKSRGFGFLCYENQMSTDLAVDNFNGAKILGRVIRVDHVSNYRPPKDHADADEISKFLREKGVYGADLTEITNSNSNKSESGKPPKRDEIEVKRPQTDKIKIKEEPRDDGDDRNENSKKKNKKNKHKRKSRSTSSSDNSDSSRSRSRSVSQDRGKSGRRSSRSVSRDRREERKTKQRKSMSRSRERDRHYRDKDRDRDYGYQRRNDSYEQRNRYSDSRR